MAQNNPLVFFFKFSVFNQFQICWLLNSSVFLINCKSNGFSMKFFFLSFRTSSLSFHLLELLLLTEHLVVSHCCFLHSSSGSPFFNFHKIFNLNHPSSTIVTRYVEPINITLRVDYLVCYHCLLCLLVYCS